MATEENMNFFEKIKTNTIEILNNPEVILPFLLKIIVALLIYWIGKIVAKKLSNIIAKGLNKSGTDPMLINFLKNFVYYILLAAIIVAALGSLGIETTSLLGILAAAGLAIGLALKDSLSNIASGVMLVMFRPFKIGDFVEIAGFKGDIEEIKIFSTIIKTKDNRKIIIPNSQVTGDAIINYTAKPIRRVDIPMGVGYDDDLKKARDIMMKTMMAHPLVLEEPAPTIITTELADSSVNFSVRPWSNTGDYWSVYSDLLEQFKSGLEEGGCNIPYPQTDVHLHQVN